MTASPSEMSVGGLDAFFERWRELRASREEAPLQSRLVSLFDKLRPLLPASSNLAEEGAAQKRAPVDSATLAAFLPQMTSLLTVARRQGVMANVWSISGLKRDEVRNAGVLASLFDPRLSDDRAQAFLSAFLVRLKGGDRQRLPTKEELATGYSVQTEARPLGALDDRVDLSIEGADFLLLIEVKIDAREGAEQLSRYEAVLRLKARALGKRPALVYLSPIPAKSPPPSAFYADWSDVRRAALSVVAQRPRPERSFQDLLLAQFAEHVRSF